MTERGLRLLMVEDSEEDAELIRIELQRSGYSIDWKRVQTEADFLGAIQEPWDLIISDFQMPMFDGLRAFTLYQRASLDTPFIFVSGAIGEERAVEAMRVGAKDYILKDNLARLNVAVKRELREAENRRAAKRLEEQLVQAQKMEAIGRLAGGIAHDFNNLLTAILSFGSMAASELAPGNPVREDIEEILRAARRAESLTGQLLAFSRRKAISPRVINLNDLIVDIDRMLRRLIGEDIDLVTAPAQNLWNVCVDPSAFDQVLVNLAVNARDAMPNGGKLSVETSNAIIGEGQKIAAGEYVVVAVSDSGLGMDAETLQKIFEPFFTTKEPGRGTGLGLSTCYGIVSQAGGSISVESEVGIGTTFRVHLPRAHSATADLKAMPAAPVSFAGTETILVTEDDDQVRKLVVRSLRRLGYQVLEAPNGAEAIRVCGEHQGIALMITDVVMPGISGRELSERVSALQPNLKVLFMSGYTEHSIVHHGVLDPGIRMIQKPFTPSDLAEVVRRMLDGL
jgi:two-component system, cell cycle sensor histidine kinase and response regulator CckA